jgi:hypothetical protein
MINALLTDYYDCIGADILFILKKTFLKDINLSCTIKVSIFYYIEDIVKAIVVL